MKFTRQAHGEFIVSSETMNSPWACQVNTPSPPVITGGQIDKFFQKIPPMGLMGNGWANCFRTHNELTMGLPGKYPLAPSVWDNFLVACNEDKEQDNDQKHALLCNKPLDLDCFH